MGRGDTRSRKGKIFAKSFGKRRPKHHKRKNTAAGQGASAQVGHQSRQKEPRT